MATKKTVIGRVPVNRGAYKEGTVYYQMNIVQLYHSSFQSKVDNNTTVPATKNEKGFLVVNEEFWSIFADATNSEQAAVLANEATASATSAAQKANEAASAAKSAATTALTLEPRVKNLENDKQDTLVSGTTIKTLNGESVLGEGNIEVKGGGITPVTYAELKALRDGSKLEAGAYYRITDYVTTAVAYEDSRTGGKVKSANHPFDVIVRASSANKLYSEAEAAQHEGDEYFNGNDLTAWKLWYDLDNDNTKYAWADSANGKGVIYRMIDEKGNDCPYDFKNILMFSDKFTSNQTPDSYYYTFSYNVGGTLYDGSVEKQVTKCYGNVMKKYVPSDFLGVKKTYSVINFNIFLNTSFGNDCHSNTFGSACSFNTFGNGCYSNTLGRDCYSNTFGNYCGSNTFGNGCYSNTFGSACGSNTFGNSCYSNTFGTSCHYNTFGISCGSNEFRGNCNFNTFEDDVKANKFGNDCHSNTFGSACSFNTFGNGCYSNTLGIDCYSNTFGNDCGSNTLGNILRNRQVSSSNAILQSSEQFYDDGSGQVVPVRHPDLSTQPSILPYKIGGQYVYEQVITNLEPLLMPKNSILLNVCGSYTDSANNRKVINQSEIYVNPTNELIFPKLSEVSNVYIVIQYFIKPEEGGYYGYGY